MGVARTGQGGGGAGGSRLKGEQVKEVGKTGGKCQQRSQGGDQKARCCLKTLSWKQSKIFGGLDGKEMMARGKIGVKEGDCDNG